MRPTTRTGPRPESRRLRRLAPGLAVFVTFLALSGPGLAQQARQKQEDQKPKNLKVLPKDISRDELTSTMRSFAQGLGVRCNYCHVGEEGKPLDTYDFASDQKRTKKTARLMMKMTRDLNSKYISKVKSDRQDRQVVGCVTCHHGQPVPQTLEQALTSSMAQGGVTAAVQKYRELREKYYGHDTFDFSDRPLNEMARGLLGENRGADATALLDLNVEFHPESPTTQVLLGEVQLKAGDKARATAYFQKALKLDPGNRAAKTRLAELGGTQEKH